MRRTGSAWTRARCTAVSATLGPQQPPLARPCSTHPLTMSSRQCCPSALPSKPHGSDSVAGIWTGVCQTIPTSSRCGHAGHMRRLRSARRRRRKGSGGSHPARQSSSRISSCCVLLSQSVFHCVESTPNTTHDIRADSQRPPQTPKALSLVDGCVSSLCACTGYSLPSTGYCIGPGPRIPGFSIQGYLDLPPGCGEAALPPEPQRTRSDHDDTVS